MQDNYRVVLTLGRATPDSQDISFEAGVTGESYIQFAKPEKDRSPSDFDQMVIFFGHGNDRLEITGSANQYGRLAKLSVETPAPSFPEAEKIVFGAASPFLSAMAFELDVPVRVMQMDVTQKSTGNGSMTYTCPYTEMVPPTTSTTMFPTFSLFCLCTVKELTATARITNSCAGTRYLKA